MKNQLTIIVLSLVVLILIKLDYNFRTQKAEMLPLPDTTAQPSFAPTSTPSASPSATPNIDNRIPRLTSFYRKYQSKLANFATAIVTSADRYSIDPRLLAAISMVESTGCKHYIFQTNNCLGWGSGTITFPSIEASFETVAKAIGTSRTYKAYQKDQSIYTFASIYNNPYKDDYARKINKFFQEI